LPTCCPVKIGPTLPAPWCCRRAALPAGCRRAARGAAGPCCRRAALPVNSRPVAPRSRPVTREALPAPWCCRSRSAPRSRPVADVLRSRPVADVLPVVLPARAADVLRCRSRSAPRSRPVADVLPVKIGCRPVVLPTCCAPGRLPHAPGPSLGKHCRPVVLPVKIGPTLPARGAADVLRSRPVADVPAFRPRGAAGQLPAGCRAAGYLTVGGSGLRPNRGVKLA